MRNITIGLASLNTQVGDFVGNTGKVEAAARQMAQHGCAVGCFQEQVISGYPCEDLVQWTGFVEQQWTSLHRLAALSLELAPLAMTVGVTVAHCGHLYNCVAVICNGQVLGLVPKQKLPTYNVFYEGRTLSPGRPGQLDDCLGIPLGDLLFRFPFGTLAVEVCEDIWSPDGPMRRRAYCGAELIINASASPWRAGVVDTRREMVRTRAADNECTVVYVNQYGGQDALVFDGGGFVYQNGRPVLEAERWIEHVSTCRVDLDATAIRRRSGTTWRTDAHDFLSCHPAVHTVVSEAGLKAVSLEPAGLPAEPPFSFIPAEAQLVPSSQQQYFEDLISAMVTGLAGYVEKTGAFQRVGIALSGGKDSVLTLLIAWMYAKKRFADEPSDETRAAKVRDFICCFSMPTRFNSETTRSISKDLCEALGVSFHEASIEDAFAREVEAAQAMLGPNGQLTAVTLQNIQARIRGERMWNWSNSASALWLQTGNMSERAVGYTTIGGDLMGGYSLIGNMPKTVVIALLRYLYRQLGFIVDVSSLNTLLQTKASAELAENQSDEDDLMPFPVLDACFALFAGDKLMPAELYLRLRAMYTDEQLVRLYPAYRRGLLKEWVRRFAKLFVSSIFKWVQVPQAVHLGPLDLDRERALQLPVVQSRAWLQLEQLDTLPD